MIYKVAKEKKGITLIALVITIIVLLILAGITISMLFGENGLIIMAQKAKNEYEEAAKNEEQQLAGAFERNYVTYNGQLHVEGTNIVNQYGETIQLRGLSADNGRGIESLTHKYYNKDSLSSLKDWGANVFRIPVDTDEYYNGYVSDPNIINRVFEIADICIDLNMYVVIDWHTLYEGNPNVYVEESKEFFTKVANRYKDVPNILYEICNEPNGINTTWDEIKKYANEVIPIIKEQNNDAIVIVGTPYNSSNIDNVINSELEYENIMYTCHMYADNFNKEKFEKLKNSINSKIPVFITEWGCAAQGHTGTTLFGVANIIANYMNDNNISWCHFSMGEGDYPLALVKKGKWDDSLSEDILSESGKYIKRLLKNETVENISVMMEYKEDYAFWNKEYRDKITSIVIEDSIDEEKISNSIKSWNMSYIEDSKNVIAYIEYDKSQEGTYILHILGNGEVYTPPDSQNLFSNFINLRTVDFGKLNTSNTNNMAYMFYNNCEMREINLSNFNTSNVSFMEHMFENCSKLKNIDLSSFDTTKVYRLNGTFSGCTELASVNLTSFNTINVDGMSGMFAHCENLEQIDLSNFNTENVSSMRAMFAYCYKLKNIIFGDKYTTDNVTDMSSMFFGCELLSMLDLDKFHTNQVLKIDLMFSRCYELRELDFSSADFSNVSKFNDMFKDTNDKIIITVKDTASQTFIQNRLKESGITTTVQIK